MAATFSDSTSSEIGIVASLVALRDDLFRQPLALGAEDERERLLEIDLCERPPAVRDERDPPPGASSNPTSGTRKSAPAEARSARGEVGSAQPSDSATEAPNAPAVRTTAPTFPGSATRHSATPSNRLLPGRSARR